MFRKLIASATICAVLAPLPVLFAEQPTTTRFDPKFVHRTNVLGGVNHPSADELLAMHKQGYILRARDGKLTKVSVEKSRLPFDRKFHPQGGLIYRASDRLIYVKQATLLSKSTDGGRTWTSRPFTTPALDPKVLVLANVSDSWQVLRDGTFVRASMQMGEGAAGPATIYRSRDEGRTWKKTTEIPIDVPGTYDARYVHWGINKLPDDTLLYFMDLRKKKYGNDPFWTAATVLIGFCSTDGGRSWSKPIRVCDWVAEGGIAQLPSGNLLASVRYQRPLLPSDSQAIRKVSGDKRGFKHHFLIGSHDGGRTWKNLRPLTTVFGQCFGYPAAQSDGTVVVIHDTRYGPGPDAARAMVSHDEGKTWENEVYYMYYGKGMTSYSRSVVLSDDTILTIGGTSTNPDAKRRWQAAIGSSHLTAIRWKPVKK